MRSCRLTLVLALYGSLVGLAPIFADSEEEKKSDTLPPAEEVIAGFESKPGFFRVYLKKSELRIEIPRDLDGKEFFFATSFAGGNYFHGWQWSDHLVSWERFESKLLLVEKDVRHRADSGTPVGEAVGRTYTDRIVLSLPILGEGKGTGRGFVIDGNKLLAENARTFFGDAAGDLDHTLAKWEKVKCFENNCELAVTMPERATGKLITLHYSLARLMASDYKPRAADPRVGYFITAYKDFSNGKVEDNRFVRWVNRWNLVKKDATLKLSPAVRPIVFYIEKTVPVRFRRYVREGILEWNKAFEKIGFDGAIEVRQQTEENEFKEFDPEDSRYNFFRWVTAEIAMARGPTRVNPRSGEILDADVIFDDSMARFYLRQYDRLLRDLPRALFSPRLQRYFEEYPEEHPYAGFDPSWREASGGATPFQAALRGHDRSYCDYGEGIAHEVALAGIAAMVFQNKDPFGDLPEEFIGPVIREIVMHEIGHTLGLRHNFKASTWKSMSEINASGIDEATVGSVMDYTPINVVVGGEQKQYMTATIGPYDHWAIEYGYAAEKSDADLKAIASRGAESGLDYGTDEDVFTGDPTIHRYDHSREPLEFALQRLDLVGKLVPALLERVTRDGDGFQQVRDAFGMLLYEANRSGWVAASYVGGAYLHRDQKGDPNGRPPLVVVPAAKQREALATLCRRIFAADAFPLPPELLTHLAAGRWAHWGSPDMDTEPNYPVLEQLLAVQSNCLTALVNPESLGRIRNCELKLRPGEPALGIPELLDTLTNAVFSELWSGSGKVDISALRQNLQRDYLQRLIRLTLRHREGPAITQSLARHEIEKLADRVEGAIKRGAEPYTLAHLEDSARRIRAALEAEFQAE